MKKHIKYLLRILLIIIALIFVSTLLINKIYGEKIQEKLTEKLSKHVNTKIESSRITLSLIRDFPAASIKVEDLVVFEANGFSDDTLIYAQNMAVSFNIADLIRKKYIINNIYFDGGKIDVKYDVDNNSNFNFLKNDTSKSLIINRINLENISIQFQKLLTPFNINWDVEYCDLEINKNNISIKSDLISNHFKINNDEYLENKSCKIFAQIKYEEDSIKVLNSNIKINDFKLNLSGLFSLSNFIDVKINTHKQQLSAIISEVPQKFINYLSPFVIYGELDSKVEIKGTFSDEINPYFNLDFSITKGIFDIKSNPFILEDIIATGNINNGKERNFNSTLVKFSEFKSSTENGFLNGSFTIENLNKNYLNASLNSSWDLSKINYYFKNSPFINLKGGLLATTNYSGFLSFDESFINYFLEANHKSEIELKKLRFNYLDSPLEFKVENARCKIKDNNIEIENGSFKISNSDLLFNGMMRNFIPYLYNKANEIDLSGELLSNKSVFDELILIKNLSNDLEAKSTMPEWLNLNLKINSNYFTYNEFSATDVSADLEYNSLILKANNINAKTLDGEISADFILKEPTNNYIILTTDFELEKIDIKKCFSSFNDFNQTFITNRDLNGRGTAEVSLQAHWKPGMIFNEDKLKIKSHLVIEKGELIEFDPLKKLSVFIKLEDLKHVKFSTLENTIEIENRVITIPAMEINSSALSLFLSGTHTFDKEINYSVKLLLSEILSNDFKNKENKFGKIKKDGENFTTAYLKMTGNTDDIKVSFDGVKIKENIKENISTELNTIKKIIKEDLLNPQKENFDEDDIIIEWEKENLPE